MTRTVDLIARKRDGGEHSAEEIRWLIDGYVAGEIPDYQMAAWLMAVRLRGMSPAETLALTRAMVRSGEQIDLSSVGPVVADKHSTGGVGDTVTLVLAPLVAACGIPFAKISGRGLGHTGGTLDKLESIPGFHASLSSAAFRAQLERVGVVVAGQTAELVPADSLLYALRDATATIEQESLLASSIMSKKIATGATAIVLDVKVGEGSFLPGLEEARALARTMVALGQSEGRRVRAVLSDMAEPLGRSVGNALEVREAVATLRGEATGELLEMVLALAADLLLLAGAEAEREAALSRVRRIVETGVALEKFAAWMEAQGADPGIVEGRGLPHAPLAVPVKASRAGWVTRVHSLSLARAGLLLGAGREIKEASIDPAVGVVIEASRGTRVMKDEPLAWVHARSSEGAQAASKLVREAFAISDEPPEARSIILEEL